jgi:5-methylcytosine-specific restriction endonuclease McrA
VDPEEKRRVARRKEERLRVKWRKLVLARDGETCMACAPDFPLPFEGVQVAHVTPMREFRAALGIVAGTVASYRDDNLVLLCVACHAAQESAHAGALQIPSTALAAWIKQDRKKKVSREEIEKKLGFERRVSIVAALFAEIMEKRGWQTVEDLGLEPDLS